MRRRRPEARESGSPRHADRAFRADGAVHRGDQAATDRQAKAGAGRPAVARRDTMELLEDPLQLGLGDAGPPSATEITSSARQARPIRGRRPVGTYLSALSRRLNTTCSSKVASALTNGRSGAIVISMARSGELRLPCATASRTTSPASTRSRLTSMAPASRRVMSRRFETKRDSLPVSSSIVARRSSREEAGILSPSAAGPSPRP